MQISGERERIIDEQPVQASSRHEYRYDEVLDDLGECLFLSVSPKTQENSSPVTIMVSASETSVFPYGEFETRKTPSLRSWYQMGVPYQKRKENESILSVYETGRVPFLDWSRSEREKEKKDDEATDECREVDMAILIVGRCYLVLLRRKRTRKKKEKSLHSCR